MRRSALHSFSPRAISALFLAIVALLVPQFAFAGEANVVLKFTKDDTNLLWISLVIGTVSIVAAILLMLSTLGMSPGNEKMREVGKAIKEGALAYLKKQISTMVIFIVLLAAGLYFLYGTPWIALCFVMGVTASYVAGFTGMMMAVEGNMRTANASLTSYGRALRTAFRSGAVSGLITVGMGLIGATTILLIFNDQAMRLLIGFGFGGSLAALFMRVGGGIFTKAADVGADLVGKVEAGIPEDDPRNPATIADNVGDNVGDCAGMAADVFESYEVTLVAAIVLGAATAAIFDQQTWMKLVLFALMARGVGIIASIIGILLVKGSDDLDKDPLKPIRVGFYQSAGVAILLTLGLSWYMMGGRQGTAIKTETLTSAITLQRNLIHDIESATDTLSKAKGVKSYEIDPADLVNVPELKKYGFTSEDVQEIQGLSQLDPDQSAVPDLSGYHKVDFNGSDAVLGYAMINPALSQPPTAAQTTQPKRFASVKDVFAGTDYKLIHIKFRMVTPDQPAKGTTPAQKGRTQERTAWFGPITQAKLDEETNTLKTSIAKVNGTFDVTNLGSVPVSLYADSSGDLLLAYGGGGSVDGPTRPPAFAGQMFQPGYYKETSDTLNAADAGAGAGVMPKMPPLVRMGVASVSETAVPWYMFFAAVAFGILMAFAIEYLTDYYVSTHKKPVQEVAAVSTTGPATMIIQGFAYACESSVFMVFSIVVALLMPLFFFPPATYGSYLLSFYGIALVGLGLLTTTGYVLAMDTFGPISDNAQGVYEMSGAGHGNEYGMKAVSRLDAAGNTTKALTKGFAIATAVVAAVALFHSYIEDGQLTSIGLRLDYPEIFLGLLIGGAAPYLFSASTINAVGRAAFQLIHEVRRQFRNDPGIMKGTSKPDYGKCVSIVTAAAQQELLGPAILAICLPVAVAFGFSIGKEPTIIGGHAYNLVGAEALGGFLAGAILSGQLMAVLLANSGGMWDNAKKLIEDGLYGGKGSESHKAGVVCDTVGDPFKDTAGPAMNPLIKVMNLVALLLAPVIIQPFGNQTLAMICVVAVGALAFSVWWSKRASMSTGMQQVQAEGGPAIEQPVVEATPKPSKKIRVEDDGNDKS